jgi:hypothetical protein
LMVLPKFEQAELGANGPAELENSALGFKPESKAGRLTYA